MTLNEEDEYVLSTGKIVYANCGILGIGKDDNGISVYEGYDGSLDLHNHRYNYFTKEERKEISDYVISLWKEWAK